jgi:phage shock protein PspC (stress-responsive transcriptional regulator)
MSAASDHGDTSLEQLAAASASCPLTPRQQTRNLLIYAGNWSFIYLASPATYVGLVHATLLKKLGFSDAMSNLPAGVYLWATPLPVLVAWLFPQVRQLKPLLITAFLAVGSMGALVTTAILLLGPEWVLAAQIVSAAVLGCSLGVIATCQWEMLGRGVSETRRGQALAVAFGAGPLLAVVASLGSQLVLGGKTEGIELPFTFPAVEYPWSFALLFGSSVPIMALAALLSSRFLVPLSVVEIPRQPFVSGVLGGISQYFSYRLILITAMAYILVYAGHEILQNISLYTQEALGESPEKYAGFQLTLRFGFKIVAGFSLGWLLVRTNPKMLLIVTALLTLASVAWALGVPGKWFLVSFGILGAGELFGVYYPNYILGCSPPSKMRRNMAFTSLIIMPVGFAPILYGFISDTFGAHNKTSGFQMSFVAAMAVLVAAILLVLVALPAQPRPRQEDMDESDRVTEARKYQKEGVPA